MDGFDVRAQRLAALCVLGLLLFSYPLLGSRELGDQLCHLLSERRVLGS